MTSPRMPADVVIVGAGPAGIAAAVRAAGSGARVVVLDEGLQPGGQIWRHRPGTPPPDEARRWLARFERCGAAMLAGTKVVDVQRLDGEGFAVEAERGSSPLVVTARSLVIATGARELFLPFPGWTLPGVIGIGGAQALLKSGASFAGKRVVIAGSGPLLLPVAAALSAAGARVLMVAEQAPIGAVSGFAARLVGRPSMLLQAARYRAAFARTPYRTGTWVRRADGDGALIRVTLTDGRTTRALDCDVLCAAFGLVPNTELARLLGCTVGDRGVVVDARQATSVPGVFCAGEPTGIGGADLALVEGEVAGLCAAGRPDDALPLGGRRATLERGAARLARAFTLRPELKTLADPDTIVCRCEDVPLGAISPAWSMRQAKLYTRCGMGPCQGRVCGAALHHLHGWEADTVRSPVEPVLLSTLLADAAPEAAPPDSGEA